MFRGLMLIAAAFFLVAIVSGSWEDVEARTEEYVEANQRRQAYDPRSKESEVVVEYAPIPVERGLRNNNPGNIVRSGIVWAGEVEALAYVDHEPTFEQFETLMHGTAALIRLLYDYRQKYNRTTISKISGPYCPTGPLTWARGVSMESGFAMDEEFRWLKEDVRKLVRGIAVQENGSVNAGMVMEVFDEAWDNYRMAKPSAPVVF